MPRALGRPTRKIGVLVAAAGAAIVVLALAPDAWANFFDPEHGGSPNADRIDTLWWIVMALAVVVFLGVEGALIYAVIKFRARRGAVAEQIHGNTTLEISWTVGAAVILVILAVVTFAKLGGIRHPDPTGPNGFTPNGLVAEARQDGVLYAQREKLLPPGDRALNVCVNGQQYIWRFTYSHQCNPTRVPLNAVYSYTKLVVPTNTTVTLDITAQDVAHSWWIPKLGGKFDAVPGYTNHTWFKISRPGTYYGQCAELCGRNHANMVAMVTAMPPQQFEAYLVEKKREIAQADQLAAQSRKRLQAGGQP
jgi:cytochrome c oxidase subunit 2